MLPDRTHTRNAACLLAAILASSDLARLLPTSDGQEDRR
jgi:hypothetical protein